MRGIWFIVYTWIVSVCYLSLSVFNRIYKPDFVTLLYFCKEELRFKIKITVI